MRILTERQYLRMQNAAFADGMRDGLKLGITMGLTALTEALLKPELSFEAAVEKVEAVFDVGINEDGNL